jgi:hypothetical protein
MTPQEFDYIRRANEVLRDPSTTPMAAAKICRVISQIYKKQADELEMALLERVDNLIQYNNLIDKLRV